MGHIVRNNNMVLVLGDALFVLCRDCFLHISHMTYIQCRIRLTLYSNTHLSQTYKHIASDHDPTIGCRLVVYL